MSPAGKHPARVAVLDWRKRWSDPLLTVLTVLLTVIMFVMAPLQAAGIAAAQEIGFAIAVVVIGAIVILSGSLAAIAVMVIAFGLALAAAVLRLQTPATLDVYLKAAAWILMGMAFIWVVSRAVFASGRVTYHRVIGAILLYLAIGWTFAGLFTLVGLLVPNAVAGLSVSDSPALGSDMLYFSFGTLTTAGSGDIAPIHPIARSLVNIEAMIGQLYPATLLARLVTLEIEGEAER
jgi:Ion channel